MVSILPFNYVIIDLACLLRLSSCAAAKLKQNVRKDALVAVDSGQRGKYALRSTVRMLDT